MRRIRCWGVVAVLVLSVACSRPVTALPAAPLPSPTRAPPVVFPSDAGPHDALTEWWYYTGHLQSERDGRTYGFEFTVFQVRRQAAPTGYLAHFAISDIAGQRFSHQAHFVQGEPAAAFPLDINGWTLATDGHGDLIEADMQPGPGADPPFGLSLRLTDQKPPALHHGGYIEYGAAGGSYYYSRTRLEVGGQLRQADGEAVPVSGEAWMDHQWGNFVIAGGGGWDWYSLQLDDRTELMLYVLRGPSGETTGVYGTRVLADGLVQDLQPGSVRAEATGRWTSPHTGAVYPSGWQLTLPDGARLDLRPQLQDQELYFPGADQAGGTSGTLAYWEGAVSVSGDRHGLGYVELTGYAGR
jgi:predicted secreted hydrolase